MYCFCFYISIETIITYTYGAIAYWLRVSSFKNREFKPYVYHVVMGVKPENSHNWPVCLLLNFGRIEISICVSNFYFKLQSQYCKKN